MNLSQVEIIVEIAKAGSISQAAQNLFVSQPSVSKALQRFEEEVGTQIFERVSTGVRLTPIGRKFVEQAADVVELADRLDRIFDKNSSLVSMELNLASISYHFIQQMIPEVYNKYSQNPIVINYVECGFDEQLEMLKKGEVEIGVVSFWHEGLKRGIRRAAASGVEYHRVGDLQAYIGVSRHSKAYPESVKGLDLSRLAQMPLVSLSPSAPRGGPICARCLGKAPWATPTGKSAPPAPAPCGRCSIKWTASPWWCSTPAFTASTAFLRICA